MKGEYKLFRQAGGRAAFAHVHVELRAWDGLGSQVTVDVRSDDSDTAVPDDEKELFDAARAACGECVRQLAGMGYETKLRQVVVRKLMMNLVDTRVDAVSAAAFLAVASAFGAADRFQLIFQGEWRVVPAH